MKQFEILNKDNIKNFNKKIFLKFCIKIKKYYISIIKT